MGKLTKGERREAKRRNARKMRVDGAGAKKVQQLILRKAKEAKDESHI